MKLAILIAGAAALASSVAFSAPVPMDEILSTPAGKWLLRELRVAESSSGNALRAQLQLQDKFTAIRERYRNSVSSVDGSFSVGNSIAFDAEKHILLRLIAAEELTAARNFVEGVSSSYNASSRAFLTAQEDSVASATYRAIGSYEQSRNVYHLITRPVAFTPPAREPIFWETALEQVAAFFRIRPLTPHVTIVPEAEALNRWLMRLNVELEQIGAEKIPLTFREFSGDLPHIRVKMITARGEFPIRLRGDLRGQDPVLTFGAILATKPQLAVLKADQQYLEAFETFFRSTNSELLASDAGKRVFHNAWENLAQRVTGTPTQHAPMRNMALQMRTIGWNLAQSPGFRNGVLPSRRVAELFDVRFLHREGSDEIAELLQRKISDALADFQLTQSGRALEVPASGFTDGHPSPVLGQRILDIQEAIRRIMNP